MVGRADSPTVFHTQVYQALRVLTFVLLGYKPNFYAGARE